jgi:hypothetical protein
MSLSCGKGLDISSFLFFNVLERKVPGGRERGRDELGRERDPLRVLNECYFKSSIVPAVLGVVGRGGGRV